jgi:hypothetical protein
MILEAAGTAYLLGVLITWIISVLCIMSDSMPQKVLGARLVFLAPIWVVPAAVALYDKVRWLWRMAHWNER